MSPNYEQKMSSNGGYHLVKLSLKLVREPGPKLAAALHSHPHPYPHTYTHPHPHSPEPMSKLRSQLKSLAVVSSSIPKDRSLCGSAERVGY